jgi:predicted adenylyl cyclase CyaB
VTSMAANIEIKARARDFERQRKLAEALSEAPAVELSQEDVFFSVPKGRLKLRTCGDGSGEIIYYDRADACTPRVSNYYIYRTGDAESFRSIMSLALGVQGIVKKRRTLFKVGDIRIHVDRVEGLGDFIELEYVMRDSTAEAFAVSAVESLMARLEIGEGDAVSQAYIDLARDQNR